MHRIECVKEIFQEFSADKSALSIVHVNGKESETCFPFIVQPAASDNCLCGFVVAEGIHDEKKYIAFPAVVCFKIVRNYEKRKKAQQLKYLFVVEILDGAEAKETEKQCEIYVLFCIIQSSGVGIIPGDFGNAGEQEQVSRIFGFAAGVQETFYQ